MLHSLLQLLEALLELLDLPGFQGDAHGLDVRVEALHRDGRDARLQLAVEEPLADLTGLVRFAMACVAMNISQPQSFELDGVLGDFGRLDNLFVRELTTIPVGTRRTLTVWTGYI